MNIKILVITATSLLFLMIGTDKFFSFLEPPCTLEENISPLIWRGLGILQIAASILIWTDKYRKFVVAFFFVFMIVFTLVHLYVKTYDIGGAVLMSVLLGFLLWNPRFITNKWRK